MKILNLLMVVVVGSSLSAQTGRSLLENSPFLPPGKAAGGSSQEELGPASLAKLQLRGITSIDGEYIFSIYDPDTRDSKWMAEGVEEDGLLIKSFDLDGNTVVIHSESEDLSRQMKMNDYSAPSSIRPITPRATTTAQPARPQAPGTPSVTSSSSSSLVNTQQQIQRPTRRNLETLRARRAELAEKLRKQPKPSDGNQGDGGNR